MNKKILKVTEKDLENYVNIAVNDSELCVQMLTNMFEWDMPIPKKFFEELLIKQGVCAFWILNGVLIVTPVQFIGDINVYGVGNNAYCVTKNGTSKTFDNWTNNNDVVICFNNYNWEADREAKITQDMLDESNVSINCDIKGTRYSKIFKARDETEKANIETAIAANAKGLPQVIVGTSLGDLLDSEFVNDSTQTLEVSDLKSSDRLQYVSKLKDDIWKWFLNLYGLSALSNVKMAQQSSDEINNQLFASFVLPIAKLECRLEACKSIQKKFNITCSVKFSKCWELSYERILHANDMQDDNDDLKDMADTGNTTKKESEEKNDEKNVD